MAAKKQPAPAPEPQPEPDGARYTYEDAKGLGFNPQEIEALMAAGLIVDELPAEGAPPNPWQIPETVEDVARILLRVERRREELARLKKQWERRSKRISSVIAYYESFVFPQCIVVAKKALAEQGGQEKFLESDSVRIQLRTYAPKYALKDKKQLLDYMEGLEADLARVQSRLQVLTAMGDQRTHEEGVELARLDHEQERIFSILDPLKGALTLAIIKKEVVSGDYAWEMLAEAPEEGLEYVPDLDEDAVLAVVKAQPPAVEATEVTPAIPFAPPGISYVEEQTKLYAE